MRTSNKSIRGGLGAVLFLALVALGGVVLTDDVVTPTTSHAGDGADPVAQNTATSVNYVLNGTNRDVVDYIEFNLSPGVASAGQVFIQPVSGGAWVSCAVSGAAIAGMTPATTHPVCDTTGYSGALNAGEITQVRVVVAD